MKERSRKAVSREVIAELMLAKTVLEEKNEIIDEKDRIIRELFSRKKDLEAELAAFKNEIESAKGMLRRYVHLNRSEHGKMQQSGSQKVIAEVVDIVADYADCLSVPDGRSRKVDAGLGARLIDLFVEKYDLKVLDGVPERIDPKIHQVVEVSEDPGGEAEFVQLARGYQLGRKLIRPLRLRACRKAGEAAREGGRAFSFIAPSSGAGPEVCSDPHEVA